MTRHVSTENLARFRAGDLSTGRSVRVAAHLRACARCRETSDALAQVPALLASVEVPPMPAHLATRIESALAAESARRAEQPAAPEPTPRRAAGARRRPRRPLSSRLPLRVLAPVGVAAALVGGLVLLTSNVGPGVSGSGESSVAGPANAAASPDLGLGGRHAPNGELKQPRSLGGKMVTFAPLYSGQNYQPDRLIQQVRRELSASQSSFGRPGVVTPAPSASAHSTLHACVSRIAAGRTVLLVDVARFDHKPATVIVTARHGATPEVWVVGSGCSATASDVLARQPLRGS